VTREEAINRYLGTRIKALETIQRMIYWDENKTLAENARLLRMRKGSANTFAYFNNLKFKKEKRWYESPQENKH
jgi:hypothetical protein